MSMDGQQVESSSGWSHLFPHVLDGIMCAMAEHEAIVFRQCGRLVNHHWCQWATQATKVLSFTIEKHFKDRIWGEFEDDFQRRTEAVVNCFTALEALTLKGAVDVDLKPLQRLQYLQHLKLSNYDWDSWGTKCGLIHVAAVAGLVSLEIHLSDITDRGVGALVSLVCLEKLNLQECRNITNASTSTMAQLPNLTDINLRDCVHIGDAGIVRLAKMTGLAKLVMGYDYGHARSFSNEGARVLGTMTNLVALDVGYSDRISDSGVEHLSSLTNLTYLSLPAHTSDATLLSLKSLTAISHLRFYYCDQMTTSGLGCLEQLCKLSRLDLRECRQTPTNDGLKLIGEITGLTSLNIWIHPEAGVDGIGIRRLTALTNLIALHFSLTALADADATAFSTLTALESLGLHECEVLTMAGLRWISVLTRLADLSLCRCGGVAGSFDGHLLEDLVCLTKLVLADNGKLTDVGLGTVSRLTNLAVLDVRWCSSITWGGLTHLASLRFLTRMELQGCTKLPPKGRSPYFVRKWRKLH